MKKMTYKRCKATLVALACGAMLMPVAQAGTVSVHYGDLILGFYAPAGTTGGSQNLEVNLGPISGFHNAAQTAQLLSQLSKDDLSAIYGPGWITRTDLSWGAVATDDGLGGTGYPAGTLWATGGNCGNMPVPSNYSAQSQGTAAIQLMIAGGSAGKLNGATATSYSSSSANINNALPGSWSVQESDGGLGGFGFFGNIDNYEGSATVVSQLYEVQPDAATATYLGDLILNANGIYFQGAKVTHAVCTNLTLTAGSGCKATVLATDVGANSTGFCLGEDTFGTTNALSLGLGTSNVTFHVTDGFGSNDTCSATVTVVGAAPVVNKPSNITTNLTSGCTVVLNYTAPTASSACSTLAGSVSCVPSPTFAFTNGITTVICTVSDTQTPALTGSNSFTVTVSSSAPPTLSGQSGDISNSVGTCTSQYTASYTVTASGCNVGGIGANGSASASCTPAPGAFSVGTHPVSCVYTDAAGHAATPLNFNVVVTSSGAPAFSATSTISTTVPACSVSLAYTKPTASNCVTSVSVTCVPDVGATFYAGSNTTVNCKAVDAGNNTTNTTSFTVTVTSSAGASFTGVPATIVTNAAAGTSSVSVGYTKPSATDCTGSITVTCVPAPNATFNVGTSNVVCTAAGHANTTNFFVTVNGAGISGISQIVSGITTNTDPKMTTARINSLLSSLTIAGNDLNKYKTNTHTHVITTNVTAACAQLNAELIKAKVYFQLHLLSTNSYSALTNAVVAEQKVLGCK